MSEESEILAEFSATRSETAFAEIIRLHTNLVFATAFRQLGDRGLAEEVTQNVFVALSQKAGSLKWDRTVAGWLYQTTLNQARQRLRSELRRRTREQIAAAVAMSSHEGDSIWAMVIPLLDEALLSLSEKDRLAVVLHFMERRHFREVGMILGVGEDAARKRVNRVVADLVSWFRKRGVGVPGTAIISTLTLEAITPVTINAAEILASGLATAAGAASLTSSTFSTLAWLMTSTQIKLTVALVALAGLSVPFILQNRTTPSTTFKTPGESHAAATIPSMESAPVGAAPKSRTHAPAQLEAATAKSFLERLNDGEMSITMLSRGQAEDFIAINKSSPQSLLAAFRVTHDLEYLRRAATDYPNDPSVLLRAVAHDAFPESRRKLLEQFKQADPDNALARYLSANQHRKDNDAESAFKELAQASQMPGFQDYVTDHIQSLEEIYLSAGRTAAESKALAIHAVELPHLEPLSELSKNIAELVGRARSDGNSAAVESLGRMGMALAGSLNSVQDGGNLLGQVIAVKMEQRIVGQLDPSQPYPFLTGSASDRLVALNNREQAIRLDSQFIGQWIPQASEQEQVSYFDRVKLYGESAAIEWLKNRSLAP